MSAMCGAPPTAAIVAKSFGDVYNQVASDGDESFPSYYAKLTYGDGQYAVTWQRHHSKYESQHTGASVDTVVHTIGGPTIAVPWFNPTEQVDELRAERCLGWQRLYAGVGYLTFTSNYGYPIGYGPLHGAGIGVERFPGGPRRWEFFTALYYYPDATGSYGGQRLSFSDVTFDGGWRWRVADRTGVAIGLYQEIRELHPGTRTAQTVRVAPYIGIDERL